MGNHPDVPERAAPFPPHKGARTGSNTRHLKQGALLFVPVWRDGAMFSCGDPHAAQGDGEVCVVSLSVDLSAILVPRAADAARRCWWLLRDHGIQFPTSCRALRPLFAG